jgi:hypothetical protein
MLYQRQRHQQLCTTTMLVTIEHAKLAVRQVQPFLGRRSTNVDIGRNQYSGGVT